MKPVLFAAMLSLGAAAAAQTTNIRVDDGSPPERDARGIPVVSAPATVPPGANQGVPAAPGQQAMPAPNQAQVFATQPSSKEYPPCTREVTDGCVQTYERGSRRPR
jgi:hypothetical protein